jgi:hypothetical protein
MARVGAPWEAAMGSSPERGKRGEKRRQGAQLGVAWGAARGGRGHGLGAAWGAAMGGGGGAMGVAGCSFVRCCAARGLYCS